MKESDKKKLLEHQENIFKGLKKLMKANGLGHIKLPRLEFEVTNSTRSDASITVADVTCPPGFKKVIRIDPITKKQTVACVPK